MNRCRLETIRAYWSGRVAAYSAVNADELGTIQALSLIHISCPPSCLYCDDMHKCYGMSLALDDNKSVVTLCKQGGKR